MPRLHKPVQSPPRRCYQLRPRHPTTPPAPATPSAAAASSSTPPVKQKCVVQRGVVKTPLPTSSGRARRSVSGILHRMAHRRAHLAQKLVRARMENIHTHVAGAELGEILARNTCAPIGDYKTTYRNDPSLAILGSDSVVTDAGGAPLALLLKGLNGGAHNTKVSMALVKFSETYRAATSNRINTRDGERRGLEYYLCGGWVGLGQKRQEIMPSATFLKTVTAFDANLEIIDALKFTTDLTNAALKEVDPNMWKHYSQTTKNLPNPTQAVRINDDSIWLGKGILIDKDTQWHRDANDLPKGWCALAYFGSYHTGDLYLPDVAVRLHTEAGDIALIRSRALTHFVDQWVGEGRYVVVYFSGARPLRLVEGSKAEVLAPQGKTPV